MKISISFKVNCNFGTIQFLKIYPLLDKSLPFVLFAKNKTDAFKKKTNFRLVKSRTEFKLNTIQTILLIT
ncbi:hypothetical protein BpHYR1_013996 [Brachionus plicatilis]|uniref:Uncharacterized protein n=1 Tax=Brachionus plicatilis TaxID=10195 RepID=A0A3M7SSA8_BRAPC|nr:hypothetical protein BpHYR1_013996 [Brachionus plicatilis]